MYVYTENMFFIIIILNTSLYKTSILLNIYFILLLYNVLLKSIKSENYSKKIINLKKKLLPTLFTTF